MCAASGLCIRRASRGDLADVLALYRELDEIYTAGAADGAGADDADALWRETAADPRQQVLVAELDGAVVGTLTVIIVPNLGHSGRPWAAVENVVVRRDRRGSGIGTALMAAAGEIARRHGCYKIVLSSNLARRRTRDFYRRLGWRWTHAGFSLEL